MEVFAEKMIQKRLWISAYVSLPKNQFKKKNE